ncbi:TonB-dependent receptor [Pseudomonas neustonica]|uniref:TonB-dependent receptor n=1 Tax=Pseudomonas neustonica TaxID=2487346 RepID=A0ABX9XGK6_9PSED|nr:MULTISPECIES: TonB-dependent receptor [Pseudomonas]ROZ80490.1 TonB-dependent receptor [Pseudomonas sp. SSM44]ROZ81685.1 TonB-dependent receptor [Pseudomonas neustonica]|tara:strand:- start:1755 stop:3941 length:2187 start_codon:yes stop_codon:yes gene_type:complete
MSTYRVTLLAGITLLGLPASLQASTDPLLDDLELPKVLSATRLKQAPAEVPGSMTVLDRQLIRATGARDIPEILRLVPGMMIGYRRGNQINVNYHGTNVTEARRLQVLIDGRSVYRPGFATVDWAEIPVAVEDIDRIEVFRGPNTAAYGANALMGVINIITRHPRDTLGTTFKLTKGTRGVNDWLAREGFSTEYSQTRLTLSGMADEGFDFYEEPGQEYRDGKRLTRVNLSSAFQVDTSNTIEWQLAASETSRQSYYDYSPFLGAAKQPLGQFDQLIDEWQPDSDIRGHDYVVQGLWKTDLSANHSVQILAYGQHMERLSDFRACDSPLVFSPTLRELSALSPLAARRVSRYMSHDVAGSLRNYMNDFMYGQYYDYLGDLGERILQERQQYVDSEPACFDIDQHIRESRYHLEVQDTFRLNEQLRFVSGASYRQDRVKSETFFGGTVDNAIIQAFGNAEYRPHDRWLFQFGGMYEDSQLVGDAFSPRVAMHYFITPLHSLRFVYSEAVRTPDMYENNINWTYNLKNISGPVSGPQSYYATAVGPGDLDTETMRSREIGYNGTNHRYGVSVDLRVFQERITGMNSEPLKLTDFYPNNDSSAEFEGAEAQIDWRATYADRFRLTYAYVDFEASSKLDQRLTARNSGSAAWIRSWPAGIESSLIYYGADQLNERRFERVDTRLEKEFALGQRSHLNLALVLQHRLDDEPLTWDENRYESQNHYYLSAELHF